MNYYIITGTSRGLGEAIALRLMEPGNHLFCISRNESSKLTELAGRSGASVEHIPFDLTNGAAISGMMASIFGRIDHAEAKSIVLINNAGTVTPIAPIERCADDEIIANIAINLTAPILLASAFIDLAQSIQADKKIINISSGAGKKPYFGWSSYCSAKAGLDLFTRCTALEQEEKAFPVRAISFAPGIIDTEMQAQIRATNVDNFKDLERFISFKEEGMLLSPEEVAHYVVRLLESDYSGGEIVDIKQLQ